MPNEQVVAHFHGKIFQATVNAYGVAVVAAGSVPLGDDPEHHELARLADDGGAVHE